MAAVALVAAAAAVDAIRDDGDPSSAREPPPALVRALAAAGAGGTLLYTDASCRLHALRLPELDPVRPPPRRRGGCRFSIAPDGRAADTSDADWSRDGETVARCVRGVLRVEAVAERALAGQHRGCPAAWRPGGQITYARGGAIYAQRSRCLGAPPCERVVVSGRALRAAAARHPNLRDAARPIAALHRLSITARDLGWVASDG